VCILVLSSTIYDYVTEEHRLDTKGVKNKKTEESRGETNSGFEMGEKCKNTVSTHPSHESKTVPIEENQYKLKPIDQETKNASKLNRKRELLLAFSAFKNGQQILSVSPQSETAITSIHGLRVLSLFWVILVHTYLQFFAIGGKQIVFCGGL